MSLPTRPCPATLAGPGVERSAHFRDLICAEWIKMRSLRSTVWTLAFATLFVIGSAAVAAIDDYNDFPHYRPDVQRDHMFALRDAFPLTGYWALMLLAASIGAIVVVSEYSSGLIRTTTVAVPARGSVVLAKAVVVAVVMTVTGTVAAAGSFAVSQAILDLRDAAISLTDDAAFRALAASALLAPVCALVGMGFGVLIRHAAATIVASVFTLLMLPAFFSERKRWSAELLHTMVSIAWRRLTTQWVPAPGDGFYRATVTESWIVYAAWPVAAIALALVVVRRRDV